uniref:Uncharacterized protein n=1 Tax=Tetranychus urticae TaxID=32264 RepID=T1K5P2_TETUR
MEPPKNNQMLLQLNNRHSIHGTLLARPTWTNHSSCLPHDRFTGWVYVPIDPP